MSRWRRVLGLLAAAPGIAASAAPVGVCPACWPAYAGAAAALGLGPLLERRWMVPAAALALGTAVAALLWKAPSRRGYGPAALGAAAAAAVLAGKFATGWPALTWTGAAALVAASLWNSWPRSAARRDGGACPRCVPAGHAPSPHPTLRDTGGAR